MLRIWHSCAMQPVGEREGGERGHRTSGIRHSRGLSYLSSMSQPFPKKKLLPTFIGDCHCSYELGYVLLIFAKWRNFRLLVLCIRCCYSFGPKDVICQSVTKLEHANLSSHRLSWEVDLNCQSQQTTRTLLGAWKEVMKRNRMLVSI